MLAAAVVFVYLAVVLYIGIFAFRTRSVSGGKEDFFVANRSIGTFVFLLSLFGSNMTSFAILGSSGLAFRQGIGVYGLMASISGIVIAMSIFLIGTRIWAIGKRFGHITQVQFLRDRFDCGHIGTVLFVLQAVMLVPYIIIGVMGGGETLEGVSGGAVPYWLGGLLVAVVVMSYVFFGGMRGTALVNALQTVMFLVFGTVAFIVISYNMGGDGILGTVGRLASAHDAQLAAAASQPTTPPAAPTWLLTRDRIPFWYYVSYMFIPLSSIMFPHIAIFCLTAKHLSSFKRTVILYPLCIMVVWAPAVFLGSVASARPEVIAAQSLSASDMSAWLNTGGEHTSPKFRLPALLSASPAPQAKQFLEEVKAGSFTRERLQDQAHRHHVVELLVAASDKAPPMRAELRALANENADGVMLSMLDLFAPWYLAGLLGAAIMAVVMASDSQILALATMFSEDVFAYYGGTRRFGEQAQIWSARAFVVLLTAAAYFIALEVHSYAGIFEIAIQYAFSGYASLAPIMLAALFWKRATKWGMLAATLWVAAMLVAPAVLQAMSEYRAAPGQAVPLVTLGASGLAFHATWAPGTKLDDNATVLLMRESTRVSFLEARMLLVVPMIVGSTLLMWLGSLATRPPRPQTIERYFPSSS